MAKPKSRIDHNLNLNGELNLSQNKITEFVKDGQDHIEYTYDLGELMQRFDGKEVAISIKEKQTITPSKD